MPGHYRRLVAAGHRTSGHWTPQNAPNNTPIPPTPPELDAKPLDKVKEPKERRKGRELER